VVRKLVFCLLAGMLVASSLFAATSKYKESPMLATLVAQGKLPSVEKRLPDVPVVVKVEEKLGVYGGTLRMGVPNRQNAIGSALEGRFTDQNPFLFDKYGTNLQLNWLEKAVLSEDAKTFTITIRKGVKWSDGTPLTTDDMIFSWVELANDPELNPKGVPNWLKDLKIEKVDAYTLRFLMPKPNPLFAYNFQDSVYLRAKHYAKQFFIGYAKKEDLEKLAKDAGLNTWFELFALKMQNDNVDKPVMSMWKLVSATAEKVVCERNPYYWKVDEAGNQLPYIDRFEMTIVASADTIALKTMAGEFDFAFYGLKFADFPTYKSNEKQGNYSVYVFKNAGGASHLKFNQNFTEDAAMGDLLRTADFRKALSYAINRDEVNELVYLGQGNPVAISPAKGDPSFDAKYPMYATYDIAKAKAMLDAIGVKDVNGDGKRELPNGAKFQIEINSDVSADNVATCELVRGYWEAVGVSTKLNSMSFERRTELDQAATYHTSINKIDSILYPMYFSRPLTRFANGSDTVAMKWETWLNTDGKNGEKPSPEYLAMNEIWKKVTATTNEQQRATLAKQLWESYYATLYSIGIIQEVPFPILVTNRLKNVPKDAMNAWPLRTPSNANLAQFFFQN
jgi:peptide/nickel transport system substrate-binding protein